MVVAMKYKKVGTMCPLCDGVGIHNDGDRYTQCPVCLGIGPVIVSALMELHNESNKKD